jgi:hypothetical protein
MCLNCGHQQTYCPPRRWYISMDSHGGMILTGETEELGEKLVPVPLYHKSHMDWPGPEPRPLRWEVADWPPALWHARPWNSVSLESSCQEAKGWHLRDCSDTEHGWWADRLTSHWGSLDLCDWGNPRGIPVRTASTAAEFRTGYFPDSA